MKLRDFLDYVAKNKYVIICIAIVVVLYALGIVEFLTKVAILIALIGGAVFVGKKLQDNEDFIKDIFSKRREKEYKEKVYYYHKKD